MVCLADHCLQQRQPPRAEPVIQTSEALRLLPVDLREIGTGRHRNIADAVLDRGCRAVGGRQEQRPALAVVTHDQMQQQIGVTACGDVVGVIHPRPHQTRRQFLVPASLRPARSCPCSRPPGARRGGLRQQQAAGRTGVQPPLEAFIGLADVVTVAREFNDVSERRLDAQCVRYATSRGTDFDAVLAELNGTRSQGGFVEFVVVRCAVAQFRQDKPADLAVDDDRAAIQRGQESLPSDFVAREATRHAFTEGFQQSVNRRLLLALVGLVAVELQRTRCLAADIGSAHQAQRIGVERQPAVEERDIGD